MSAVYENEYETQQVHYVIENKYLAVVFIDRENYYLY